MKRTGLLALMVTAAFGINSQAATETAKSETTTNEIRTTKKRDLNFFVGANFGANAEIEVKVSFIGESDSNTEDDFNTNSLTAGLYIDIF